MAASSAENKLPDWGSDNDDDVGDDFGDINDLPEAPLPDPPQPSPKLTPAPVSTPPTNAWHSKASNDVRKPLRGPELRDGRGIVGMGRGRGEKDSRSGGGFGRRGGGAGMDGGRGMGFGRDVGRGGGSMTSGGRGFGRDGGRDGGSLGTVGGSGGGGGSGGRGGGWTVFVGNLPIGLSEREIADSLFGGCNVKEVRCPRSQESYGTKVAFVEMRDEASMRKALQMNGISVEGRSVRINREDGGSRDRGTHYGRGYGSSPGGGGGYGGGNYGFGNRDRDRDRYAKPAENYGGAFGTNHRRSVSGGYGSGDFGGAFRGSGGGYSQPSTPQGPPSGGKWSGPGWADKTPATPSSGKLMTPTPAKSNTEKPPTSGRPKLMLKPRTRPIPKPVTPKTPAEGAQFVSSRTENSTPKSDDSAWSSATPKASRGLSSNSSRDSLRTNRGDGNFQRKPNASESLPTRTSRGGERINRNERTNRAPYPRSVPAEKKDNEAEADVFNNSFAALSTEDPEA